jgi:exopolysaccharide biosynthesis polyprenyl glycosylphosphotransferase
MILHRRIRGLSVIHCAWQIALAEVLFWLWALLPFNLAIESRIAYVSNYGIYGAIVCAALVLDWIRAASKKLPLLEMSFWEAARRSARQGSTVMVCWLLYLVASKDITISRLFLATYLAGLFLVLFVTNRYFPSLIAKLVFSERHRHRTLIVGDPARAEAMLAWIDGKRGVGIEAVEVQPLAELPALGSHLERTAARQVMLMGFPESTEALARLTRTCERHGVRLTIVTDWMQTLGRSMRVTEDGGMQFMSFQQDVLECPINRVAKRAFDLAIAVPVCLFLLPPLCLLVWLLQRAQSPGSLFFLQARTGAHRRSFVMIKFRTMHTCDTPETRQATESDARIFAAGRWLRKLSLDEMPQFFNVLRGEMSVVGPRPHLEEHDEDFAETATTYRLRQMIKPGITGLAQVNGWRGETKTADAVRGRIAADLHYLENWSMLLDWRIVARTFWQMIKPPESAY